MKTKLILLLITAAFTTPASANWFHNPYENINRNVGSAPNPTPEDIRAMRLPIVTEDTDATGTTTAQAAKPATTADNANRTPAPQAGSVGTIAAASPSR